MNKAVYQRPDKPRRLIVRNRREVPEMALPSVPEVIEVDCFTECFVTPEEVGNRMVDYLGLENRDSVLEPQSGTGNLVQAVLDYGVAIKEIVAVERHISLCNGLSKRFEGNEVVASVNQCFLEYTSEINQKMKFDKIILNPPFKLVRKHMSAALSLLADNGVMVALVPITYQHEDAELLEELPRDTFDGITVHTKLVRFIK